MKEAEEGRRMDRPISGRNREGAKEAISSSSFFPFWSFAHPKRDGKRPSLAHPQVGDDGGGDQGLQGVSEAAYSTKKERETVSSKQMQNISAAKRATG